MPKKDYVTEFLCERFPNGVDEYGEEITVDTGATVDADGVVDEDLGASLTVDDLEDGDDADLGAIVNREATYTDKLGTITVTNTERSQVVATVRIRQPKGSKRKWKAIKQKKVGVGEKVMFTVPPGHYCVRIIKVLRKQRIHMTPGGEARLGVHGPARFAQ